MLKRLSLALAAATIALPVATLNAGAQEPPKPGQSPRIDAIRKAGVLKVGALANLPWLAENTKGGGEPWAGPAWILAKEYARLLNVKLEPVLVSHETKVPVLAANQVDMTISPLAETPDRLKAIDFVIYSTTSVCMFGRADNAKFTGAKSVDDLNKPDVTIAYFIGGGEEGWVKERFPNAKLRGVTNSGATAPVEEIMAKRADAAPINRVPYVGMAKKVKGLAVLPSADNCQGSQEKAAAVGIGIDKGQQAYGDWLKAVVNRMQAELDADERRLIDAM